MSHSNGQPARSSQRSSGPSDHPAALPPDRGHVTTEQRHADSHSLDTLDTNSLVDLFANDHEQIVAAVKGAGKALSAFIDSLLPRARAGGRLLYIGAGTSGRLGVLDASECPPTFQANPNQVIGIIAGGDRSLRQSSEAMEDNPKGAANEFKRIAITSNDTVLGIAAGGTTPYALGAISLAKRAGCTTGLLTCTQRDQPADCDHLIVLDTGPELLTGSTRLKAGSATKLALNIISTALFVQLGKTYGNLMVDLRATNDKLRDRAIRILLAFECQSISTREQAAQLLEQADGHVKSAIVMHRLDIDLPTARERLAEANDSLRAVIDGTIL